MESSLPIQLPQQSLIALFKSGELSSYLVRHLSPEEKAAVFLIAVGPDTAARILLHMNKPEVELVMPAINRLADVPRGVVLAVLDELEHSLSNPNFKGGEAYTQTLLKRAFGPRESDLLLQRLHVMESSRTLTQLGQIPAEILARLLNAENPQTIAVVMGALAPRKASELLNLLPADLKADVGPRLAQLKEVPPEILEAIGQTLLEKYQISQVSPKLNVNGLKAIGQILAKSSPQQSRRILQHVGSQSPELAEHIQDSMVRFEDLSDLTDRALQLVIQKSPRETLLYALKVAEPDVQRRFWQNMTQRQAQQAQMDMQALPPVKKSYALSQQRALLGLIRQWAQQGLLELTKQSDEEWVD